MSSRSRRRGIAWLLVPTLLQGCRAAPPPDSFPVPDGPPAVVEGTLSRPEAAAGEGPSYWPDDVDEALFGAGQPREAGASPAGRQGPDWRALLRDADLAIRSGRLEEAAQIAAGAARAAPPGKEWIALRVEADVLLALRRDADAARLYESVIADNFAADLPRALSNVAVAYLRMGELDRARRAADAALAVRPGQAEALRTLGLIDIREGKIDAGRSRLEEALRSGGSLPEAEVALAEMDEHDDRPAAALARYRTLLAEYEGAKSRDHYRRWRDLFPPGPRSTAEELLFRIERLDPLIQPDRKDAVLPATSGKGERTEP